MNKNKILHDKGLRITTARVAVLDYLEKKENPADVISLVEALDDQVDQATIYRILELLTKKDIISRFDFGEGKYRYELQKKHHHHLVCTKCNKIEDIEIKYLQDIEDQVRVKKGFLIKSHALEFFGICKNCQS